MNKVIMPEQKKKPEITTLLDLMVEADYGCKYTAFIGQCDNRTGFFLISCAGITDAEAPSVTWSSGSCPVKVDRFVDIEIRVLP